MSILLPGVQYANCDGWSLQAILFFKDGRINTLPTAGQLQSYINIYEISLRHTIKKEAIRQAADIWLNTLTQSIDLRTYMHTVFYNEIN